MIVLWFSYGISLDDWRRMGLLQRQWPLLRMLAQRFERVVLVTYGAAADREVPLPLRCEVLIQPRWCPRWLYALIAPWIHRRVLSEAKVFYTVQMSGALPGLAAAALFRRPLVVHCGFPWSRFASQEGRWMLALVAGIVEQLACRWAEAVIATADYRLPSARLTIVPNGVDIDRFVPSARRQPGLLCWVGRVAPQKNLELLLRALEGVPGVRVRCIGNGPQRERLERFAEQHQVQVEWMGTVPHDALPGYLQEAQVFVFPSAYEGDPKAVLEAMACGLPVVASDIPEHRAIIQPDVNGLLSPLDPMSFRGQIRRVLQDPSLAERLGRQARDWVATHRGLSRLVHQECQTLVEAAGHGVPS